MRYDTKLEPRSVRTVAAAHVEMGENDGRRWTMMVVMVVTVGLTRHMVEEKKTRREKEAKLILVEYL